MMQLPWCWLPALTLPCPPCSLGLKAPQAWHPVQSQPSVPAALAGTDTDPEQQEKLGLPEHPSCRANPFCTLQMDTELFGKSGWIPPVRSKESRELCFPPRAMAAISCQCPGLRQLSGKWGMPHVTVASTAELCLLNVLGFIGMPDLTWFQIQPPVLGPYDHYFFLVVILSLFLCRDHKDTRFSILACLCCGFTSSANQFVSQASMPEFSLTLFWSPDEKAPLGFSEDASRDGWVFQLVTSHWQGWLPSQQTSIKC